LADGLAWRAALLHHARVGERPPALWRLAAASFIDAAPVYAMIAYPVLRAAEPAPGPVGEADAELATSSARPRDGLRNGELLRRLRRRLLAYGWLELALICTFGRTQGMALVGLKLVRSGGGPIGITGAFVRAFGRNHLIRALVTPLRGMGPYAQGGASIALELANAAAALVDPEHRTLWNRLEGTRVVEA
jgi:hypothetical protein